MGFGLLPGGLFGIRRFILPGNRCRILGSCCLVLPRSRIMISGEIPVSWAVKPGEVFAEAYALCAWRADDGGRGGGGRDGSALFEHGCPRPHTSPGQRVASRSSCQNLLNISLHKNLALSERIFCTAPKTVRGRLLLYLSNQAAKAGSKSFRIPFDRQGLADHLNLDRSALSKELGKMRDEGILETTKNEFTLHELPE